MSEPEQKPRKRRTPAVVKVKDPDGTWRELKSDRPPSDDPEINDLWEMPFGELQKILDDPEHPLREKALVVTTQALAPLQTAVQEWFGSQSAIIDSLVKPLESLVKPIESLVPKIDTSWISGILPDYPAWQDLRRSLPQSDRAEPFVIDSIDFDSTTPPDAPLREVAAAADDAAVVVLQDLLAVQREQLAQAKADAASNDEALAVARGSRTAGWWGVAAALLAAVIGVISIIVTIMVAP